MHIATPVNLALEQHIASSLRHRPQRQLLVDALARSPSGVWIYGAGGFGCSLARSLAAKHVPITGFLDCALAGKVIDGKPVLHPTRERIDNGSIILLGVFNPLHSWAEAVDAARQAGASDIFNPVEIVELLPDMRRYWLLPPRDSQAAVSELASIAELFADERSVVILRDLLLFRLTGDPATHPKVDADDQYLATDLRPEGLRFDRPIAFLDGGAFSGDTGLFLRQNNIDLAEWAAFEPDAANFAQLVAAGRSLPATRCSFFPLGLSDRLEDVAFVGDSGAASHIGEGGARLRIVAADDVLPGFRPDYVKLDIEGAEAAALRGMVQMLAAGRPKLAVSVYHQPRDIVALTRQVRGYLPEAKLYLRQHAHNGFDTVLYAIP